MGQFWEKLKRILRRLLPPFPRSGEALLRAAEKAQMANHLQKALLFYQRAQERGMTDLRVLLGLGKTYLKMGKTSEAVAVFQQAVASFPQEKEGYRAYLEVLRREGRLKEARPFLEKIAGENQAYPLPFNYLGILAYLEGDLLGAKKIWEEVVRKWPHFAPAYGNLASIHIHEGHFAQAIVDLELVLELDPGSAVMVFNNLAEVYMLRGDYVRALEFLQRAVEAEPRLSIPWANLGHCYYALRENEKAMGAYERALKLEGHFLSDSDPRGEVVPNLAKLYLNQGRIEEAMRLVESLLQERPGEMRLLLVLGEGYLKQGKFPEAVSVLEKALKTAATGLGLHLIHQYLALAYYKMGQLDRAMWEYRRANSYSLECLLPGQSKVPLGADPEKVKEQWAIATQHEQDAASCRQAAAAYLQLGAYEEAKAHYEQALALEPEDVESYTCMGLIELSTEEFFRALWHFGRAVEINPRYAPAHVGMGLAYLWRGARAAAIAKFKWALHLDPKNAMAYYYLGVTYEQKGKVAEAISAYRQAVELLPDYLAPHYRLANLLKKENPVEAEALLRKVLTRHPNYLPALEEMIQLLEEKGRKEEAAEFRRRLTQQTGQNPKLLEMWTVLRGEANDEAR